MVINDIKEVENLNTLALQMIKLYIDSMNASDKSGSLQGNLSSKEIIKTLQTNLTILTGNALDANAVFETEIPISRIILNKTADRSTMQWLRTLLHEYGHAIVFIFARQSDVDKNIDEHGPAEEAFVDIFVEQVLNIWIENGYSLEDIDNEQVNDDIYPITRSGYPGEANFIRSTLIAINNMGGKSQESILQYFFCSDDSPENFLSTCEKYLSESFINIYYRFNSEYKATSHSYSIEKLMDIIQEHLVTSNESLDTLKQETSDSSDFSFDNVFYKRNNPFNRASSKKIFENLLLDNGLDISNVTPQEITRLMSLPDIQAIVDHFKQHKFDFYSPFSMQLIESLSQNSSHIEEFISSAQKLCIPNNAISIFISHMPGKHIPEIKTAQDLENLISNPCLINSDIILTHLLKYCSNEENSEELNSFFSNVSNIQAVIAYLKNNHFRFDQFDPTEIDSLLNQLYKHIEISDETISSLTDLEHLKTKIHPDYSYTAIMNIISALKQSRLSTPDDAKNVYYTLYVLMDEYFDLPETSTDIKSQICQEIINIENCLTNEHRNSFPELYTYSPFPIAHRTLAALNTANITTISCSSDFTNILLSLGSSQQDVSNKSFTILSNLSQYLQPDFKFNSTSIEQFINVLSFSSDNLNTEDLSTLQQSLDTAINSVIQDIEETSPSLSINELISLCNAGKRISDDSNKATFSTLLDTFSNHLTEEPNLEETLILLRFSMPYPNMQNLGLSNLKNIFSNNPPTLKEFVGVFDPILPGDPLIAPNSDFARLRQSVAKLFLPCIDNSSGISDGLEHLLNNYCTITGCAPIDTTGIIHHHPIQDSEHQLIQVFQTSDPETQQTKYFDKQGYVVYSDNSFRDSQNSKRKGLRSIFLSRNNRKQITDSIILPSDPESNSSSHINRLEDNTYELVETAYKNNRRRNINRIPIQFYDLTANSRLPVVKPQSWKINSFLKKRLSRHKHTTTSKSPASYSRDGK